MLIVKCLSNSIENELFSPIFDQWTLNFLALFVCLSGTLPKRREVDVLPLRIYLSFTVGQLEFQSEP